MFFMLAAKRKVTKAGELLDPLLLLYLFERNLLYNAATFIIYFPFVVLIFKLCMYVINREINSINKFVEALVIIWFVIADFIDSFLSIFDY